MEVPRSLNRLDARNLREAYPRSSRPHVIFQQINTSSASPRALSSTWRCRGASMGEWTATLVAGPFWLVSHAAPAWALTRSAASAQARNFELRGTSTTPLEIESSLRPGHGREQLGTGVQQPPLQQVQALIVCRVVAMHVTQVCCILYI